MCIKCTIISKYTACLQIFSSMFVFHDFSHLNNSQWFVAKDHMYIVVSVFIHHCLSIFCATWKRILRKQSSLKTAGKKKRLKLEYMLTDSFDPWTTEALRVRKKLV